MSGARDTTNLDGNATYEATVITGLEFIAVCESKLKLDVDARESQGRIVFESDRKVEEIVQLRSINNLFVIVYDMIFDKNALDDIKSEKSLTTFFEEIISKCDWSIGLKKWLQVSKHPCSLDDIVSQDKSKSSIKPKFRVSCYRSGENHLFTSPQAACALGGVINDIFHWPVTMKEFDIQVVLFINKLHLYIGITLTPESLCCRNIIVSGITTLRSPTCYAMLKIGEIQCGDIVVDPMAGTGAIPVECCAVWGKEPDWFTHVLVGELNEQSLDKSKTNMSSFPTYPKDLINLDATKLPFLDSSIDLFVSDIPFGRRHGSKKINKTLYPSILLEMARCARIKTGRAVLLTQDKKSFHLAQSVSKKHWRLRSTQFVKIGNLNCHIFYLRRNNTVFSKDVIEEVQSLEGDSRLIIEGLHNLQT